MNQLGSPIAADDVYTAIKQSIANGEHACGAYLREAQLARALGVSRTPVREAFRRLGSEGWLEVKPHFGVRVKTWSMRDIDDIFEARVLIEPYLIGRAATNIGSDDLRTVKDLAQRMVAIAHGPATAVAADDWFFANATFHDLLTAAGGNQRLDQSLKSMKEVPLIRWTFNNYQQVDRERSAAQHLEIVQALEIRDNTWAEAIVRCHIRAAQVLVRNALTSAGMLSLNVAGH